MRIGVLIAGLLVAISAASPARAEWRRAESAHFVVYGEGGERALRSYVEELEILDGLLRREYGVRSAETGSGKLPIYLVDGIGELRRVSPGAPSSVGGFYSASSEDIYAVAMRGAQGRHSLQHEYLHHFMLQHRPYPYPAWLIEGVAEYWATTDIDDDAVVVGKFSPGRVGNLQRLPWVAMEDLLGRRPMEFRGSDVQAAYYAQAWLLTHYLARDPARRPQLAAYMKAVGEEGADPVRAMTTATGMDPRALTTRLRDYLESRLISERFAWKGKRPAAPMSITVLPPSADDLLLERQALKGDLQPAEKQALLAKVRARAAKHGGDRLARLALAEAETRHGDRAKGEAILTARLAEAAEDVEALALLADSKLEAAEAAPDRRRALHREAAALLRTAYKLEPTRYQTLTALARARSIEPSYPTAGDLELVLRAHELAPQVSSIRLWAAEAAAKRREWQEVRSLLTPLVNNPHGGEEAAAARTLLAQVPSGVDTAQR